MKYDIVIVDTGYNGSHPRLRNRNITGIQICKKDVFGYDIITLPQDSDDVGHGTAISNIIYTHAPDASILMVKIFDKLLYVDEDLLLFTLNYILSNVECKLINLSPGISALKDYKKMYNICDEINKKGTVIVAAFDNDGSVSFPAAFDNVVGVTSNNYCYKNDEYFIIDNSIVNVGANGNMQKSLGWITNIQ
ncbi:MAG: S8 family serine peptidase [Ruminococcaceae bacterium]|nr:S8 family serine peptidase [Oscillospiraceae bacterium]